MAFKFDPPPSGNPSFPAWINWLVLSVYERLKLGPFRQDTISSPDLPPAELWEGATVYVPDSADGKRLHVSDGASWSALGVGGGGEVNTNSSAGGVSLVNPKVGVDTPIRGLLAGSNISIFETPGAVVISYLGGEEGSFTPILSDGALLSESLGVVYNSRSGFWRRDGSMILFNMAFSLANKGSVPPGNRVYFNLPPGLAPGMGAPIQFQIFSAGHFGRLDAGANHAITAPSLTWADLALNAPLSASGHYSL